MHPPLTGNVPLVMRVASQLIAFARLPRPARLFYLRAVATAIRTRDRWSLRIAVRPLELGKLVVLAGDGPVAELGTGTGWSALALAACGCNVFTCDPIDPPQRQRYLELLPPEVSRRVEFSGRRGEEGPPGRQRYTLVFVDASHRRDETVAMFEAWRPAIAAGGAIAFHDYSPAWPEVVEATDALSLDGEVFGSLFIWREQAPRT
jgi:Methyltransferase domain